MLLIYALLLQVFVLNKGFFTIQSVFLMIVILGLFLSVKSQKKLILNTKKELFLLVLLSAECVLFYGGIYQNNIYIVISSYLLLSSNLLISIRIYLTNKKNRLNYLLYICTSLIVAILMILSSPNPRIDVYEVLNSGAKYFLNGENPYSQTYKQIYVNVKPDYYAYLPGMIYITSPFYLFFRDIRISNIVLLFLTTFLIYLISKKPVYPLLFIANPIMYFVIEQSWTEPIIVFLITLTLYLMQRSKITLAAIFTGLMISTKQYGILAIPLFVGFLSNFKKRVRFVFVLLLIFIFALAPFLLWDSGDFIYDISNYLITQKPRYDGIGFFSLVNIVGINYNWIITIFALVFVYIKLLRKNSLDLYKLSQGLAFMYFVFFFFNKWSFINYFYLVSQLSLVASSMEN